MALCPLFLTSCTEHKQIDETGREGMLQIPRSLLSHGFHQMSHAITSVTDQNAS